MFGMQDPSQTLQQIERYMAEGRLELSEVMATQFCDMMLGKKKREPQQQIFLLKGLRLMCDVYLLRNKADQSMASIKRMHSERKALVKILRRNDFIEAVRSEEIRPSFKLIIIDGNGIIGEQAFDTKIGLGVSHHTPMTAR